MSISQHRPPRAPRCTCPACLDRSRRTRAGLWIVTTYLATVLACAIIWLVGR